MVRSGEVGSGQRWGCHTENRKEEARGADDARARWEGGGYKVGDEGGDGRGGGGGGQGGRNRRRVAWRGPVHPAKPSKCLSFSPILGCGDVYSCTAPYMGNKKTAMIRVEFLFPRATRADRPTDGRTDGKRCFDHLTEAVPSVFLWLPFPFI